MKSILYRISAASLLLALLLSACGIHKEYGKTEAPLPDSFARQSLTDTASIADLEWNKFFTDPALQSLIEKGIAHNYDLLAATRRIEVAQLQLTQAKALSLPSVGAQLTAQYNRPADNSLNGVSLKNFVGSSHIENYNALVTANWEVDVWGKIKAQKGIALTQYLQSYEARRAVQTALVAAIAQGYYDLLMLDQQLLIARRNLALSDSFVTATRLLKDAGIGNALAVQQAEAQRGATALLLPQLEAAISIQENNLQQLTGQLPGKLQRGALNTVSFPEQPATGLPAALVSRRPDVRVQELELTAAGLRTNVARAGLYPSLNITAGAGLEAFKASNWFNIPGSLFGLVGGSLLQPVFQKKALRTQYETAKVQREESVLRFRQSVLNAVTEVSNALVRIEKTKEQESIARSQVTLLNSAISNARLLFKSDMASYLEVVSAQSASLQAQLNLASIQRARLGAVVELYRSLGGGWK
ncbi:MAG: efflux transporter outer membrane subunit [Chitinophagaceae bacterium]|nr:MAG: efflux transporter outer membrane subunit [Chitinophagaceae bacterium]